MSGPAVTVVPSGGLAVTPVESGGALMTVVENGGVAVTLVESGGVPFVLESGEPTNSTLPVISGTPTVGEALGTSNGTWTGSPASFAYQWYADDVALAGATASTYELQAAEEDALITVGVVATNGLGDSEEAVSAAVGPVEAAATDTTAPVLTLPVGNQTGPTTADVGATTDEANGTLYYVVTTSSTAPTKAQVKAGQTHTGAAAADDGSVAVVSVGAKTFNVTGLTHTTAYYAHLMHEDAATNQSNVVSSAQFTTDVAPDVTAPTLTLPTDTETGTTTATITVTTDEANGTLYWYLSTSAVAPSAADLKAGTGAVQASTQAISTTGIKTVNITSLTASTTYYAHFLHRDAAGNDSTIVSGNGFTTTAVGAGELDESITPPVLTLAVGATTYPPEFDADLDTTVEVGDTILLQWSDDIRFGSITDSATNTIDSAEATAEEASFTGLSAINSPDVFYFRARVVKPNNDFSAWSNTVLHGEAVDETPSAFSFTDVNDADLSTVYVSNTITLAGFNQPVDISITGGEYAIDAGSGFGAYTSAAGTAYPGDDVKVRHTSSGSNSTATNTVLTVGGVSDTYTTTTEAASVSLPTSGLLLQLDADDTSTLWQLVNGTTAAADGQPIGTWQDKSGNGFHLTAATDNTTRPTYRTNTGLPYVEFDGTNDLLRRLAELGIYDAGACTIAVAMRSASATPASNIAVLGEMRSSVDNDPVYSPMQAVGGGLSQMIPFMRNDAGTTFGPIFTQGTAFDATDNVVMHTDDGSSVIAYDDATAGTTRAYTRSGTLTLDTFSLGGWNRATPSAWFGMRVYAVAVWNRVLDSTERATVRTYMAAKQGRVL